MKTTFLHQLAASPREPRNQLREGVTNYYLYRRPASINLTPNPSPPLLETIPAAATTFALETLQFPIDPIQQDLLATDARRVIVCCTRQWGKSTAAAIKALHHAATNPAALVLIASRTLRQAGELLEKAIGFARSLDIPIRRVPLHPDSLLLPNGARIVALPGKPDSLRCFSAVSLIVVDEAAFVPDELYHALRPMLAVTNGAIWLLSTPRNRSGFFYDEWSTEGDTWSKFVVTADQCPRISPEFLEDERRHHGPAFFNREYFCDFGYTGQSYFDLDAFDAATGPERFHAAEEFALGRPTNRFYVGFDLGQKSSHSAVVALERISGATNERNRVTFELIQQTHLILRKIERFPLDLTYDNIVRRLARIVRDLGDPRNITLMTDATGCGQPFLEILRRERMGVLIHPIGITSGGYVTNSGGVEHVPKKDLMRNANHILNSQVLSGEPGMAGLKDLREEMEAYRLRTSRAGSDSFRTAFKDDLVMAFSLAAWKTRHALPRATE